MAFLGVYPGLPHRPPYPLKLLSYSTFQTYDKLKAIPLLEVAVPKTSAELARFFPWAGGTMVLALQILFYIIDIGFFLQNSLIHIKIHLLL